jgi:hypothetical protein
MGIFHIFLENISNRMPKMAKLYVCGGFYLTNGQKSITVLAYPNLGNVSKSFVM